jgi:hypothetical protein
MQLNMGKPRPSLSRPRTGVTLLPSETAAVSDVTVSDDNLYRSLVGVLPSLIARVERSPSGATSVIWHREPTPEQWRVAATIAPDSQHAW